MTLTANLAPVEWPTPATDETLDSNLEKWRQKNREILWVSLPSSKNPHFQNEAICKVYLNENKKSYLYQRLRS